MKEFLNGALKGVDSVKNLIPVIGQLHESLPNGILCCELVNATNSSVIDLSAVNRKAKMRPHRMANWNLCLAAAKSLGCDLSDDMTADDLSDGDVVCYQIIWEIMRRYEAEKGALP